MRKAKTIFSLLITLFLFVNLSIAQTQVSFELKNISINRVDNKLEVQLELNKPFNYESFTLLNPNRLVIDLLQVENFLNNPYIEVNEFGVQIIRTAKNKPDVTRVVFNLEKKLPLYIIEENEKGLAVIFWFEEVKEEKIEKIEEIEKKPIEIKEEPVKVEMKKEEIEKKEIEKPVEKIPSILPEEISKEEVKEKTTISIGLNSGFYFIQDTNFQNSYGKNAFFFGGETSFQIPLSKREYIGASLSFKSISKTGLTIPREEEIKLKITPISFAVLYLRQYGIFSPFVGFGVDYHNYKETYPDTFAISYISGSTWGISFHIGIYAKIIPSLSLKLYFKYHDAKAKENGVDISLGGNEYGLGLAYHFKI